MTDHGYDEVHYARPERAEVEAPDETMNVASRPTLEQGLAMLNESVGNLAKAVERVSERTRPLRVSRPEPREQTSEQPDDVNSALSPALKDVEDLRRRIALATSSLSRIEAEVQL
jgi:uncharacterized small protein (DUF1192 family)